MGNKGVQNGKNINSSAAEKENNWNDSSHASGKEFKVQQKQTRQTNQRKTMYQHDPVQLAKDQKGRLHPKWSQIVKKSQQRHKQRTNELVGKISSQVKRIDSECTKRYGQDQNKLSQCFQIAAEPVLKIEQKSQQCIMTLGQIANKCLLKNKKQDQCIEQVRKHLHGCLENTYKEMAKITLEFQ